MFAYATYRFAQAGYDINVARAEKARLVVQNNIDSLVNAGNLGAG